MEIYRRLSRSLPMAAVAAGAVLWISPPAGAQSGGNDVIVDLSVLEGDRGAGLGAPLPGMSGRQLLMPGARLPQSQLHVPTAEGKVFAAPKLKKPKTPAATAADVSEPATADAEPAQAMAEPMPAKEPEPAVAAAPPEPMPEPMTSEPATAAPEPVAEEKPKPAELKKAEPAPPPPPPETAMEKAPEPVIEPEKSAPAATEQAARAPVEPDLSPGGLAAQIVFDATATKMPESLKAGLGATVEKLKEKSDIRLQLMAYAGGGNISTSKARRMSLSRALSVRSFLIEKGIRSTRIDVRALGNKTTDTPINRVDVKVVKR